MASTTKRITYQPYLFALAFLTLLSKVAYSLNKGQRVLDPLLWIFVAVFLISSLLYYLEVRNSVRKTPKSISANIKTGNVTDSEVTGVLGTTENDMRVKIATKDVNKSTVRGYEEKP